MNTLYFLSRSVVPTSQGELPEFMFTAEGSQVSALRGFNNPPGLHPVPSPIYKFISGLQGSDGGPRQVTYADWNICVNRWDLVVETAKVSLSLAKIAKPGEVWKHVSGALYCVIPSPSMSGMLMSNICDGYSKYFGPWRDGGILLDDPDIWTCYGLITDLVKGAKS